MMIEVESMFVKEWAKIEILWICPKSSSYIYPNLLFQLLPDQQMRPDLHIFFFYRRTRSRWVNPTGSPNSKQQPIYIFDIFIFRGTVIVFFFYIFYYFTFFQKIYFFLPITVIFNILKFDYSNLWIFLVSFFITENMHTIAYKFLSSQF